MNFVKVSVEEKEVGKIFKKKIKIYRAKGGNSRKTLYTQKHRNAVIEAFKKLGIIQNTKHKKQVEEGLMHTFPTPHQIPPPKGINSRTDLHIMTHSDIDHAKYHAAIQLLGAALARISGKFPKTKDKEELKYLTIYLTHVFKEIADMETISGKKVRTIIHDDFGEGYAGTEDYMTSFALLRPFSELRNDKEAREIFVKLVAKKYANAFGVSQSVARTIFDAAIDAADEIGHLPALGKLKKAEDLLKSEAFLRYAETVKQYLPKEPEGTKRTKKKVSKKKKPSAEKLPKAEKTVEEPNTPNKNPSSLALEAQKLLGILNGLKYAGYPEEGLENLGRELERKFDELLEERDLEALALYSTLLVLIERGRLEEAEGFLKGILEG